MKKRYNKYLEEVRNLSMYLDRGEILAIAKIDVEDGYAPKRVVNAALERVLGETI